MSTPTIGFIGLGLMGAAMVGRLQDKGYRVTVTANRSRPNIDAAVARGASEVATARDVAAASDIVMLCMDTSASVESRMRGPDGVIAGLREAGGTYLDAPLGRTPAHAKDGLLNIMAAGEKGAFDTVEPVLKDLGENVFHLGALGSGHTIKLMNNFFGMTVANAMSEAFAMADIAGVDREQLYNVMAAGPLHSGMMDFVKGYAVDGDPTKLEFAIKNAAKDVGYYSQMAQDAGVDSIMSKGTLAALEGARDAGQADDMVSQMVEYYARTFAQKSSG